MIANLEQQAGMVVTAVACGFDCCVVRGAVFVPADVLDDRGAVREEFWGRDLVGGAYISPNGLTYHDRNHCYADNCD